MIGSLLELAQEFAPDEGKMADASEGLKCHLALHSITTGYRGEGADPGLATTY